jgi:hypothetical protein
VYPRKLLSSRTEAIAAEEKKMKSNFLFLFVVMGLASVSVAKELPDAPSALSISSSMMVESAIPVPVHQAEPVKTVDAKFLTLAIISTGSTFADSYTTLFARENWLAGKTGVCNEEVESAYLYGTHPTVGRVYAVAAAKSSVSILASYYLRKHHSKLWSLPMVTNSIFSLQGVTQNMIVCN